MDYLWDQAYNATRDVLTAVYPGIYKRYAKILIKSMGKDAETVFPP